MCAEQAPVDERSEEHRRAARLKEKDPRAEREAPLTEVFRFHVEPAPVDERSEEHRRAARSPAKPASASAGDPGEGGTDRDSHAAGSAVP